MSPRYEALRVDRRVANCLAKRLVSASRSPVGRAIDARGGTESGLTLLEVVVALVILSLAVVGVMGSLTVLAASSFMANERANVGAVVRSAAEAIKAAPYQSCKTGTPKMAYSTAVATRRLVLLPTIFNGKQTVSAVATPRVVGVYEQNKTTPLSAGCATDPSIQFVEVTDAGRDHRESDILWVAKYKTTTPLATQPVITTNTNSTTFTQGLPGSFTFTATGTPAPTFSISLGILPNGVTFGSSGVLSGTPLRAGTFPLTIRATNQVGSVTKAFTLVVNRQPPNASLVATYSSTPADASKTSFTTPTFAMSAGDAYLLFVSRTPDPADVATTLPVGNGFTASPSFTSVLAPPVSSYNTATKKNSEWVYSAAGGSGTGNVTISFTNAQVGMEDTYIAVVQLQGYGLPPVVPTTERLQTGNSKTAKAALRGTPSPSDGEIIFLSVSADAGANLPSFSPTGLTTLGYYKHNGQGSAGLYYTKTPSLTTYKFTIPQNPWGTIALEIRQPDGTRPTISSPGLATFTAGQASTYVISATGTPFPTFSVSGHLPTGVSLTATGSLHGTPTTAGTYQFTVAATNTFGSASQAFTLTVNPAPPAAIQKTLFLNKTMAAPTPSKSDVTKTFTMIPGDAYAVFVARSPDTGDNAVIHGTKFGGTLSAPLIAAGSYNTAKDQYWLFSVTGGTGTGKLKVTFTHSQAANEDTYIEVVQLSGQGSPPLLSSSRKTSAGTTSPAHAVLAHPPAPSDGELIFISTTKDAGKTPPPGSPSGPVELAYTHGANGSMGAYFLKSGSSTTFSFPINKATQWGSVAIEVAHA